MYARRRREYRRDDDDNDVVAAIAAAVVARDPADVGPRRLPVDECECWVRGRVVARGWGDIIRLRQRRVVGTLLFFFVTDGRRRRARGR